MLILSVGALICAHRIWLRLLQNLQRATRDKLPGYNFSFAGLLLKPGEPGRVN